MRIVAGAAGGRRLEVPASGTRPTSDRVREALFSSIESRMDLDGASVLDLYSGSGALGLEALSRGAAHVVLVESNTRAAAVLAANVTTIAIPGAEVRQAPVETVLRAATDRRYDLVLADPPYALSDDAVESVLVSLVDGGWLNDDAIVVVERSSRSPQTRWPSGLESEKSKKYGESRTDMAVRVVSSA